MSRISAHGTGEAHSVPTRTGGITELDLCTEREITAEVNDAFRKAAAYPPLKGILGVLKE